MTLSYAACAVIGCDVPACSRGWCNPHYQRWYQHGDPEWCAPTPTERFLARVDQNAMAPCWEWIGTLHSSGRTGYGWTGQELAHRASYELFVGPIPTAHDIDHECHNRSDCPGGPRCPHRRCVNPEHLKPDNHRANVLRGMSSAAEVTRTNKCVKRSHPLIGTNLYIVKSTGARRCLACVAIREGKPYEHYLV